jgi:type IV pilus assembly protein PilB
MNIRGLSNKGGIKQILCHIHRLIASLFFLFFSLPRTRQSHRLIRRGTVHRLQYPEKRAPQDGRFTHQFAGTGMQVDIRAATLPTKYGERITMRLLGAQSDELTLAKLGFVEHHRQMIEQFLRRIQGMMVLTGPTGSGKTTTLYVAMTKLLKERAVNIMTVEDPIEYEITGAAQCEMKPL